MMLVLFLLLRTQMLVLVLMLRLEDDLEVYGRESD